MPPFAPCFAGSVAGAQVYLRARSVIHNGYSACWNEGEPSIERVNHQRMGSFLREPIPVYEAGGTGSASRHQEPAHLPDVLQALLISGQLLMCFADFHSFFQSVRDVNSSTMSSNRWSCRSCLATAPASFLLMCARFASLISAISSRSFLTRSDTI